MPNKSRGVTLVEVLVSMLLMALGILAMAAQQASSIKHAKTSEARALASLLANDLADRMRANRNPTGDMVAYQMKTASSAPTSEPAAPDKVCKGVTGTAPNICSHADMAAFDLAEWRQALFHQLPQGTAYVTTGTNTVNIWIAWTDPDSEAAALAVNTCPTEFVANASSAPNVRCMLFNIVL